MADDPDLIKRVTDALSAKGVSGSCPMCHHNEWMIEDASPFSRIEVTNEDRDDARWFRGFYPTYWLYCGNCGFVAQFMKPVVDGLFDENPEKLDLKPKESK
jgi:hypothetical protein